MEVEYKALTIQIPKDLHKDIKTLASSKGMKIKELVIDVLEEKLYREGVR